MTQAVRRSTARARHRPARARAARLRRQRPALRRDPGPGARHRPRARAEGVARPSRRSARSPRARASTRSAPTWRRRASADVARLRALFAELDARARALPRRAGFRASAITARYQLNLRYPGQNWSLAVPVGGAARRPRPRLRRRGPARRRGRALPPRATRRSTVTRGAPRSPRSRACGSSPSRDVAAPRFARRLHRAAPRARAARTRRANLGDGFEETAVHRGPDARARATLVREPRDHRGDLHDDRRLPGLGRAASTTPATTCSSAPAALGGGHERFRPLRRAHESEATHCSGTTSSTRCCARPSSR